MRSGAAVRGTFGKGDASERALPAPDERAADRHGASADPDGSLAKTRPRLDQHPQRVRRDHFLSEIF